MMAETSMIHAEDKKQKQKAKQKTKQKAKQGKDKQERETEEFDHRRKSAASTFSCP